jgi:cytochrome c biogenesis protein
MIKDSVQVAPIKKDFLDVLWDFFSSGKMALWLLALSAVSIFIGTIVEQNKPMETYVSTYGPTLAYIIQVCHIYDLYHSWWFEILMALICLNLFLSNFNRAEKVIKKYYQAPVQMDSSYFKDAKVKLVSLCQGSLQEVCLKLENAFLKMRYEFKKETAPDAVFYYADRGKLALWGSFVAHIGLLILFAGVVYGHFPGQGFDRQVMLLPGGSYYIPEAKFGFVLRKFEAKWNSDRLPVLYRSTLDVMNNNGEQFAAYVEVNQPLVYRNVKVYQATYAPGVIQGHYVDLHGESHPFQVQYQDGQMMFFTIHPGNGKEWVGVIRDFIPDIVFGPNGQVGSYSKEPYNPGINVMVVTRTDKMPPDPKSIKEVGWLTRGTSVSYNGVKIYFDHLVLASGFEIKRDLGVPLIFTSFIVIILGVCLTFYFSHKVIRTKVSPVGEKIEVVSVASRRDREQDYAEDFEVIKEALSGT